MALRRVSLDWNNAYEALKERATAGFRATSHTSSRPSQLYHFTDCDGLVGILKSRTLWASLATSLNDRSEIEYGQVLAKECVTGFKPTTINLGCFDDALTKQTWRVYVVSFCANAETALHWLHYGRSGSGVAVGFDSAAIERHPYELCPVLYNRDRQIEWITAVIRAVDDALGAAFELTSAPEDRDLLSQLAVDLLVTNLWMVTPRIKSDAFSAENEWRLITYVPRGTGVPLVGDPTGSTEFRTKGDRIVPYKKVPFDVIPVSEIVIGSSAPILQDSTALRVLLEENVPDIDQVKVSESAVRVRV